MDRCGRLAQFSLILLAIGVVAHPVQAQEGALVARCRTVTAGAGDPANRFCNLVVQAIEITQAPLGLSVTGGNPVPGTASTLGMRIGTLPRFSIDGRVTGVWVEIPQILDATRGGETDFSLPSLNVDGAVGVFQGFSPAPTVGGVASLDLLGSAGVLLLPEGDGFQDGSAFTWALGARFGVLRESFTLPGISLSAMYRHLGDVTFGDPRLVTDDAAFDLGLSILSLRAALSKRVLLLGVTAGLGYDRYSSDVDFGFVNPVATGPQTFRVAFDGFDNDRVSAFANLSWTLLILHVVGEVGWQQGADLVPAPLPARTSIDPEDGRFFAGFAIRISV